MKKDVRYRNTAEKEFKSQQQKAIYISILFNTRVYWRLYSVSKETFVKRHEHTFTLGQRDKITFRYSVSVNVHG